MVLNQRFKTVLSWIGQCYRKMSLSQSWCDHKWLPKLLNGELAGTNSV